MDRSKQTNYDVLEVILASWGLFGQLLTHPCNAVGSQILLHGCTSVRPTCSTALGFDLAVQDRKRIRKEEVGNKMPMKERT